MERLIAQYMRVYEALFVATFLVRIINLHALFAHQPVTVAEPLQVPFMVVSYSTFGIDALTMLLLAVFVLWERKANSAR